jgi:hypothetical protein
MLRDLTGQHGETHRRAVAATVILAADEVLLLHELFEQATRRPGMGAERLGQLRGGALPEAFRIRADAYAKAMPMAGGIVVLLANRTPRGV